MPIIDGTPVDAATTNPEFIYKKVDDTAIGKITLANVDTVSGGQIDNIQQELNSLNSFVGKVANTSKNDLPTFTYNDGFSIVDDLKSRVDALSSKFDATLGHTHSGTSGDAPNIFATSVGSVQLKGSFIQGVTVPSVIGSSHDVSALLLGEIPSNSPTDKGVVVNDPYNRVILRKTTTGADDKFVDALGNEVYGRLTYLGGVWTLSFYVDIDGTETVYSFASSTDMRWYYQKLFNPITDAPVYSELAITPSENTTADVVYASSTTAGKVLLANAAPSAIADTGSVGVSTRVALQDHTHEGVHSLAIDGDSVSLKGDVLLKAGTSIGLTRIGNKIELNVTGGGAVGYQEIPAGPVNGVNTTFGPLTFTPSSTLSVIVFVDGLPLYPGEFSLSGLSIILTTPPVAGQVVSVFYLYAGTPIVPPTPTGVLKTEFRTITALEETNKSLVLANTPASPSDVLVDFIGGSAQIFNVDYTISSNNLTWLGYGLDGFIGAGDVLRIHYIT